jgi:thioredoxin-related protein
MEKIPYIEKLLSLSGISEKQIEIEQQYLKMRKTLFLFFLILPGFLLSGQKTTVKWYSIEEAEKLAKSNPRPMMIDTYTDWCGWCKKLDQDTFSNQVIAEILNTKFYPVKFDAEGKYPVTFQGKKFINDGKSGNANQLAVVLLSGQLSYPNLVFLNDQLQLLTNVPGYREPKEMEALLLFFAEKAYEKQNFQDYQKNFKGKIQ